MGVELRSTARPAAPLGLAAAPAELDAPPDAAELAAFPLDRLEPDAEADEAPAELEPETAAAPPVGRMEPDTGVVAPEVDETETVELDPDRRTTGAAVTMRLAGSTPFEMVEYVTQLEVAGYQAGAEGVMVCPTVQSSVAPSGAV